MNTAPADQRNNNGACAKPKRISLNQKRALALRESHLRARWAMETLIDDIDEFDLDEDLESIERDIENQGRELLRAALQKRIQLRADATPPRCPTCGAPLKAIVSKSIELLSRFGPITIRRDYGRCPKCKTWSAPADAILGAKGTNTPRMAESLRTLGTVVPPGQGETLSQLLWGMRVDDARIDRELTRAGKEAIEQRRKDDEKALDTRGRWAVTERVAPALAKGSVMIIMADAFMTRERDDWGRSDEIRAQGGKPERWHESKVGTIFLQDDCVVCGDKSQRPVILRRSFVATREGAFAFGQMLFAEAVRQGLLLAREVYFIADGGVWLWTIHKERFAGSTGTIDYFHASQHLWAVARARCRDEDEAREWVTPLLHQLRHGGESGVLSTLEGLAQTIEEIEADERDDDEKTVLREWNYFASHRDHLDYGSKASRGLPIGSGCIESTCKQYQIRVKRCGQFWSNRNLEGLLCLYGKYLEACMN